MMPPNSTALEYQPAAPSVADRFYLYSSDAMTCLTRILNRMGMSPHQVAFSAGDDEEVRVDGRGRDGATVVLVRIFWGQTVGALTEARDDLIRDGWHPKPPKFETILPDGRTV